jgi:hypothetical protein
MAWRRESNPGPLDLYPQIRIMGLRTSRSIGVLVSFGGCLSCSQTRSGTCGRGITLSYRVYRHRWRQKHAGKHVLAKWCSGTRPQAELTPMLELSLLTKQSFRVPIAYAVGAASALRIRKTCSSHGGDYEEWRLLGCYAVWFL